MTGIIAGRVAAGIEGHFVVFLTGMRINKPWKVHKWLPAADRDGVAVELPRVIGIGLSRRAIV